MRLFDDRIAAVRVLQTDRAGTAVQTREKAMRGDDLSFAGLLIIEALAQAGGILAYETATAEERLWILYLVGIEETRFKQTVRPGDQLTLRVELVKRRRNLWRFVAAAADTAP